MLHPLRLGRAINFALALFLFPTFLTFSQEDSTMQIKRFSFDDLDSEKFEKYKSSSSTNRLAESPDDLTHEVIIIDGDEIRKFGYSTLVDVLKSIPGFRTSQPGNAVEGETFLMRGLLGNDHTKILINGIPIKPEAVKAMPIAAQLPIRHAEYIEIVQGPSSATYGSDAMAGVINIVFPEVDRPVFAWADVNGITPATTEFNLTLGGKAGAGKNIINYQFFASSQRSATVNLLLDPNLISVDTSTLNKWEAQYFVADSENPNLPEINSLKRESRLVGASIQYRWFELYAMNMYREEHSALGSAPLAISYSDPGATMGENINTIGLRHVYTNNKRFTSRSSLSLVTYKTLDNASYTAIRDSLSSGLNFIFARSIDVRGEYQGILKFNKQLKMAFGTTAQYSITNPYTSYLGRRVESEAFTFDYNSEGDGGEFLALSTTGVSNVSDSISAIDSFIWIPKHEVVNIAAFTQFLYKAKGGKLNLEAAARYDLNSIDGLRFSPSLGMIHRPNDALKIVVNYSRGHRAPRSYHIYNNYRQNLNEVQQAAGPNGDLFRNTNLLRRRDSLGTERLQGAEARVVWDVNNAFRLSGRYYAHLMENRLTRQVNIAKSDPQGGASPFASVGNGYYNNRKTDTYSFLNAVMITAEYNRNWEQLELRSMISYEFASGYEEIEGEENVGNTVERTDAYRFVPTHSVKANISLSFKGFTFSFQNNFYGDFVSDIYVENNRVVYTEDQNYFYNLDILMHKELFRQLSMFVGTYNVLNSFQSGLPASSLSNISTYNPQYGRIVKLGLNFRLN